MGSSCSRVRGGEGSSNHYNYASSSRPFPQIHENSDSSEVFYRENVAPVYVEEESSNTNLEPPFTSSNVQSSVSFDSNTDELGNSSDGNAETYNQVAHLSESQQLHTYCSNRAGSQRGSLDNASVTVFSGGLNAGGDGNQSINEVLLTNSPQNVNSNRSVHDPESLYTEGQSDMHSDNEEITQDNSDVVSRSLGSGSPMSVYLLGYDSSREIPSQSSRDLHSGTEEQDLGSTLHIDMVSISSNSLTSNIREVSNRESRTRARRSFWDILSRRNLRRLSHNPAILFTIDDADDLGVHGRLLLDISSNRQNIRTVHDWGTRSNNRNGQGQSRLERSENIRHRTDEEERDRHLCPSGLHPHGTCSCDSQFMGDEFSALIRISRIVILVEAINELLDEISRQAMPFSFTALSLPAPESIVNSFPLKSHKKPDMTDDTQETQQCNICLAEYEEGDNIRVLPCKHEYHMACVDKWLKEIHGICPLCRADVCVGSHSESTFDTQP